MSRPASGWIFAGSIVLGLLAAPSHAAEKQPSRGRGAELRRVINTPEVQRRLRAQVGDGRTSAIAVPQAPVRQATHVWTREIAPRQFSSYAYDTLARMQHAAH